MIPDTCYLPRKGDKMEYPRAELEGDINIEIDTVRESPSTKLAIVALQDCDDIHEPDGILLFAGYKNNTAHGVVIELTLYEAIVLRNAINLAIEKRTVELINGSDDSALINLLKPC